jgi:hypothetical protein
MRISTFSAAASLGTVIAADVPKILFYNCSGRCREMRAFSGLRWKTHVLGEASEIAKTRNCSE